MAGAGEVLYSFPTGSPVTYQRGRDNATALAAYRNGAQAVIDACTLSLVDRSGTVLSAPTVVINPAGTCAATVPDSDLDDAVPYGEGYRELWVPVIDGTEYPQRRSAIVARFPLMPPLSSDDIVSGRHPDLVEALGSYATSLQPFLDGQWNEILRRLWREGTPADVIVEPSDVYEWLEAGVLDRAFAALVKLDGNNARWERLWDHYRDLASAARDGLRVRVDRDRDGVEDDFAHQGTTETVHLNLPPAAQPARWWRW